jgi:hypothetical protein
VSESRLGVANRTRPLIGRAGHPIEGRRQKNCDFSGFFRCWPPTGGRPVGCLAPLSEALIALIEIEFRFRYF